MEKAMAPHSSTLAWKIPWTEKPGGLHSTGSLGVAHDGATSLSLSCIGEGNGHPLQCSCLENLRDGGAWWAAVHGVAQSWTRLTWLSSSSSSSNSVVSNFNLSPLELLPAGQSKPEDNLPAGQSKPDHNLYVNPFRFKWNAVLNSSWPKYCSVFFFL